MFLKQSRGAAHGLSFKGYQGIVGNFVRISNILMVIKQKICFLEAHASVCRAQTT